MRKTKIRQHKKCSLKTERKIKKKKFGHKKIMWKRNNGRENKREEETKKVEFNEKKMWKEKREEK